MFVTSSPSSGKSLAITLFPESRSRYFASKNFSRMIAVRIDEEISGPGHALVLSNGFGVQNLVGANRFGIGIGKHREFDLAAVGEIFQDLFGVVADRREFDPLLLESCFGALQLDQLPFAVGSPIGGTEKEENRAVRSFQSFRAFVPGRTGREQKMRAPSVPRRAQSR